MNKPVFGSSETRKIGFSKTKDYKNRLGPGLYDQEECKLKIMKRSPCNVKYKQLAFGRDHTLKGSLHYEGDRLVYEPNFTDPRKSYTQSMNQTAYFGGITLNKSTTIMKS